MPLPKVTLQVKRFDEAVCVYCGTTCEMRVNAFGNFVHFDALDALAIAVQRETLRYLRDRVTGILESIDRDETVRIAYSVEKPTFINEAIGKPAAYGRFRAFRDQLSEEINKPASGGL